MWLTFVVFAAGSVMGATGMWLLAEIRLRRQADRVLREIRLDEGDPTRISSDWMRGHLREVGKHGDAA